MDSSLIIAVIGVLAVPIAAFLTWFLNRKKNIADIYEAIAGASGEAVEAMQMTMQELRIELSEARIKIEELIAENELLREDLAALKTQNEQLMIQIHDMRVAYEQNQS
jgi:Asp-tRNA(Asn)/Glu-tRNA(Gln) amidotransferase B subunit